MYASKKNDLDRHYPLGGQSYCRCYIELPDQSSNSECDR